jgi:transposase
MSWKNGFSKDNKSQQPQILVALMVTKEGFPIAYEIFSGN